MAQDMGAGRGAEMTSVKEPVVNEIWGRVDAQTKDQVGLQIYKYIWHRVYTRLSDRAWYRIVRQVKELNE